MEGVPILSLMLLVPMVGAALCLFSGEKAARTIALAATLIDLALGILVWANYDIGTSSIRERMGTPSIRPAPTRSRRRGRAA